MNKFWGVVSSVSGQGRKRCNVETSCKTQQGGWRLHSWQAMHRLHRRDKILNLCYMAVVGVAWRQLWAESTLKHATVSIVYKCAALHQRKGRENLSNKAQLRVTLDTALSCSPYRIYLYSREPLWNLSRISFKVSLKCATDVSIPFMTIKLDFNSPRNVTLLHAAFLTIAWLARGVFQTAAKLA